MLSCLRLGSAVLHRPRSGEAQFFAGSDDLRIVSAERAASTSAFRIVIRRPSWPATELDDDVRLEDRLYPPHPIAR